jgi:2-oxo-3-hexenedioate decarboxylase
MSTWTVPQAASALLDAEASVAAVEPLSDSWPSLDLETAYAVQDETLRQRLARGEHLLGIKLEGTNVSSPLTAWLTSAMLLSSGDPVPRERLIQPRAEPEIVFLLGSRLAGPGVSAVDALAAVSAVYCGVEVTDSRYRDLRFTLPDMVADNGSSGCLALGPVGVPADSLDLTFEACLLEVNGQVHDSATGAAVLGHPAAALALAANDLGRRGLALEAGWIVATGGMTDAVPCPAGVTVAAHFTRLGSIFLPLYPGY